MKIDAETYLIEVDVLVLEKLEDVVDVVLAIVDDCVVEESADEDPNGKGRLMEMSAMMGEEQVMEESQPGGNVVKATTLKSGTDP